MCLSGSAAPSATGLLSRPHVLRPVLGGVLHLGCALLRLALYRLFVLEVGAGFDTPPVSEGLYRGRGPEDRKRPSKPLPEDLDRG